MKLRSPHESMITSQVAGTVIISEHTLAVVFSQSFFAAALEPRKPGSLSIPSDWNTRWSGEAIKVTQTTEPVGVAAREA